ncbi:hypothetical protein [Mycobacterium sp.]|uniref:hypothetical protein n=1 Tax=Mycobacterium sp. TaxID=1785 RepID=UPI002D234179|nr:hypothetical protein [Mycobacterium sp.]HZA12586.1 hypothetical protein [Mycobacterium sp.]
MANTPQTTPPDDGDRLANRDQKLEHIVDRLDENVTEEREQQGVPGNASERDQAAKTAGSEHEPPD